MALTPSKVAALKRQAKHMASQNGTVYSDELDQLAIKHGFQNWSVLTHNQSRSRQLETADQFLRPVYLRFSDSQRDMAPSDSEPMAPGTVQLIVDSGAIKRPLPWGAWLLDVESDGKVRIISRVRVDFDRIFERLPDEVATAVSRAASNREAVIVLPEWPLYTWFDNDQDYVQFSGFGCWRTEQVLRSVSDLTFARSTGFKPAWYNEIEHAMLFETPGQDQGYLPDLDDYVLSMFRSPGFKRASDGQRLVQRLHRIEPGKKHAAAFQQWLCEALAVLFPQGLARVRLNPNGNKASRRDVVATNTGKTPLFARLLDGYKARMVVFEAKNYDSLKPDDVRQVGSYLNAPHYGAIGFLVNHAATKEIAKTTWDQVREVYNGDDKRKIVAILPSALLVGLLDNLWRTRQDEVEEAIETWLEDILLKHLPH